MPQENSTAEQMASTMFWAVVFTTVAFVAAVFILIR